QGDLIAVIEDDAGVRDALGLLLSDWGYAPVQGISAEEVLEKLDGFPRIPDLIIADYQLSGGHTGAEAIDFIRTLAGRQIPAIILTGDTAPERLIAARRKGYILLHKPIGKDQLRSLLGSIFGRV